MMQAELATTEWSAVSFGGDFNAVLELPLEWDVEVLGGLGDRNNGGGLLAHRMLRHGLLVRNQTSNANHSKCSWTHFDAQRMELWYKWFTSQLLLTFNS